MPRKASIEPRSFKRGNVFQPLAHGGAVEAASIEPRSFKRGNTRTLIDQWKDYLRLQLSHVHSNVETRDLLNKMKTRKRASIEPRSFKRGNQKAVWQIAIKTAPASIEPRSFKRGNACF